MTTYVPEWAEEIIKPLLHDIGKTKGEVNSDLYLAYPEISKRTIRRWVRAVKKGEYRTSTTNGHFFQFPQERLIPEEYNRRGEFFEARQDMLDRCKKEKRKVRFANVQDEHVESTKGDPALINLKNQILSEFRPDFCPVLMDSVDNSLISPHGTSYYQSGFRTPDESAWQTIGVQALLDITDELLTSTRSVVPDSCVLFQGSSNHFDWILRLLDESPQFSSFFFNTYFKTLRDHKAYWVAADKLTEVPITPDFWSIHGNVSRNSYPGATANAYMRRYGDKISVAAGHSHRSEVIWGKPDPRTNSSNFVAICGTLGDIRPAYRKHEYISHNWGFQMISLPTEGMRGAEVEHIRIDLVGEYYETTWRGKQYRERKTVTYDWEDPFYS